MIGTTDTYYNRAEVSNSDLSWIDFYFMNKERLYDISQALRFGNLIDAMITEPTRCDHLKLRVDDEQFSTSEWLQAKAMMKAFMADQLCATLLSHSTGQMVKECKMPVNYEGFEFELPARCKYDLWSDLMGWGGDIKSTVCTTQAQFEASVNYFNYDRQRAWYMDISKAPKDLLIGISKKNNKIFKVPITRDSDLYRSGKAKYEELAFKYWYLFENF